MSQVIFSTMRIFLFFAMFCAAAGTLFFLLSAPPRALEIPEMQNEAQLPLSAVSGTVSNTIPASVPSSTHITSSSAEKIGKDIAYQAPLPNPPTIVKGIYATGWSAGSTKKMKSLIDLIDRTELNSIVIDIKDYSGFVSYRTGIPEVAAAGAEKEIRIAAPNALLKQLHEKGIYVIGRVSVFQDPILARAHPEWALKDQMTGEPWEDRKGLAWMDPAEKSVWAYNVAIARDAFARGFDEINFDYVRFASDGDLSRITYPTWDGIAPKHVIVRTFFEYVRAELKGQKISADLFGLATVNPDDLGIGQVIEDGYANFDFVSPMIYPSHYASGFLGYKNPASVPYEVIQYSLEIALTRIRGEPILPQATSSATTTLQSASGTLAVATSSTKAFYSKLRPWLQDFNLGATYTAEMVRKQIDATEHVLSGERGEDFFAGWLLWNPSNVYTVGALRQESSTSSSTTP